MRVFSGVMPAKAGSKYSGSITWGTGGARSPSWRGKASRAMKRLCDSIRTNFAPATVPERYLRQKAPHQLRGKFRTVDATAQLAAEAGRATSISFLCGRRYHSGGAL